MSNAEKEAVESLFRNGTSFDDLFDAFRFALEKQIEDIDCYKILIANPCLNSNEVDLFIKKLVETIKGKAFEIYLWAGEVYFGSINLNNISKSLEYFKLAFSIHNSSQPLHKAIDLYNVDFEIQTNNSVLKFVEENVEKVDDRGYLYDDLANIYKQKGDNQKYAKYRRLQEKFLKDKHQ
ncbi:MAG: hypothetical protein K9J12_04360 [Melioribacteraceae bacterium]|nr:hypothetical protein [Melioribacteraceae bacterium]MCF8265105.1 hypothetical protein [Melioribacteraceae bacterium]MCF8413224.1 hypothetical protein [Melioribacteraceae bacterium]MCF8431191.1 hypothetical protein [Melioribacteraceae bacterium]